MAEPTLRSSTSQRVGTAFGILTLIVTAINGVPAFLALQRREAAVLFARSDSWMTIPPSADRVVILKLLVANKVPNAFTSLSVSNRGSARADDVSVTLRSPGDIISVRTVPPDYQNLAWATITVDVDPRDSRNARVRLQHLATTKDFKVEVSYISTADQRRPEWDVFADGRPAREVASLAGTPANVNEVSFQPALRALGIGGFISVFVFGLVKARENVLFRQAITTLARAVLPPPFATLLPAVRAQGDWVVFKDRIVISSTLSY